MGELYPFCKINCCFFLFHLAPDSHPVPGGIFPAPPIATELMTRIPPPHCFNVSTTQMSRVECSRSIVITCCDETLHNSFAFVVGENYSQYEIKTKLLLGCYMSCYTLCYVTYYAMLHVMLHLMLFYMLCHVHMSCYNLC